VAQAQALRSRSEVIWARDPMSHWVPAGALCLCLSILYQIYFYDFSNGVLIGGERQRLVLKIASVLILMFGARAYLSASALRFNLLLKLPLLFVCATLIVTAPFLEAYYAQALNLLFFLPLLLIDWNKPGAELLYRALWKAIVIVVAVQLLLDPLLKFYFQVTWSNAAVVGGMGNPNVFGIFLVCAGLAKAILFHGRWRLLAPLLFASTVLTGSLASALIGVGCLLVQGFSNLLRAPTRSLIFIGAAFVAVVLAANALLAINATSITHAINKLMSVIDFFSGGSAEAQSQSVSLRVDYTLAGLRMMGEAPLAVLFGHPGGKPMYSGDGMWIAMFVTYGLPLTLAFIVANVVAVLRGLRDGTRPMVFSACVLMVVLAFFVTNRILDYWPAALAYLLAFGYLTNRGAARMKQ